MKNEIFERDYTEKTTDKGTVKSSKELSIVNFAAESGVFKAYSDAMKRVPKYIVQKDREDYENLLPRLDAYAKKLHGKIRGVIDYDDWISHITVEIPHFEACTEEEFALLSDIAAKADNVTFEAGKHGGIRLRVRINYFDEIGNTDDVLGECIMQNDKLVEMLSEHHDAEKKTALSMPQVADFLDKLGTELGMTGEEVYDWIDKLYHSSPEIFLDMLSEHFPGNDENEDLE